jgi:enoyl-CoA hydratase/carnithine racemase
MAVSLSTDGGIGTITLDKPPANSYDFDYIQELGDAVRQAAGDDGVRVVISQSSERFFSAGADIKAFNENTAEANMDMCRAAHEALSEIAAIPKVFIAEIAGHALGGGLEISLACDVRLAAEGEYRLGLPEVTLGVLPGNGGTQRLPRLIGWSRALELMITGRTVTPAEALELGIVHAVYPAGELREMTLAYASALATGPTRAIGISSPSTKGSPRVSARPRARRGAAPSCSTARTGAGIAAFAEKRGGVRQEVAIATVTDMDVALSTARPPGRRSGVPRVGHEGLPT